MDKDGILGILTSLNNFLNNGNGKPTDNNNNNQPTNEGKEQKIRSDTAVNVNLPPQMTYSNQMLEVISRHEQHLKKVKVQTVYTNTANPNKK